MTLEMLLQSLDQLADMPDAVPKTRELIFQLAIGGRLSSQNEKDGTGADVLAAVLSEKKKYKGKLNFPKEQRLMGGNAHSFSIPSNWIWCNLATLALQIQYGYTASADHILTDVRMLRITDIQNNKVDWSSVPGCEITLSEAEKYLLKQNDILIARTGGTIGKSFIVPDAPVKSVFASYLIRVTPPQSIEAKYLKIFLESPHYWTQLRVMSAGTGQPNVNGQALGRLTFPIPPLAEQKRIVAKVEELMTLCDRLEALERERNVRHSALTHAVVARFNKAPTAVNLNYLFHKSYSVPVADIRKTILGLGLRGHLWNSSDKSTAWGKVTLKDICLQITDGEHATPQRTSRGVPLATAKNIRDGSIDLSNTDWVSIETAEKCWRRCKPKHNDILMVCVGATTGRVCLAQNPDEMVLVRSVALIRPNTDIVLPAYLELFLRSPEGQSQVWNKVKQSAQPCLYLGRISSFEVFLPTLSEQRQIIAKVDQLMALVDQLETQISTAQSKAEHLLDALLHELLYPTKQDGAMNRSVVGCYAIKCLAQNPKFGRTMLMKVFYLSEAHSGISQAWQPMRQAAGPYDPAIEDFESLGVQSGWFTVKTKTLGNGHEMVQYQSKSGMEPKIAEAISLLGGRQAEFDRLLGLFQDKTTEEAEIIATLFAAWNDMLIDGKSPSDDEIVREVRENWHYKKERFTPTLLTRWLNWLRQQSVIPKGLAPRTRQQLKLGLS